MTVFTVEEQKTFIKALEGEQYKVLFMSYLYTGARLGELPALTWKDVNFDKHYIDINKKTAVIHNYYAEGKKTELQIQDYCKSKSSKRKIYITDMLINLLQEHKDQQKAELQAIGKEWTEESLVFPTSVGTILHPRNIQSIFDRIRKKANIEHGTMHTLRHTYATRCFEADIDIKIVSEQLGHKNVKITYYWAQPYINKAKLLGLVKDNEFIFSEPITREQIALIISRALPNETVYAFNKDYTNFNEWKYTDSFIDFANQQEDEIQEQLYVLRDMADSFYLSELTDEERSFLAKYANTMDFYFQDWMEVAYVSEISKMVGLGIMNGYDENKTFRPKDTATRAEASSVIAKMIEPSLRVKKNLQVVTGKELPYYATKVDIPEAVQVLKEAGFPEFQFEVHWLHDTLTLQINEEQVVQYGQEYSAKANCITNSALNYYSIPKVANSQDINRNSYDWLGLRGCAVLDNSSIKKGETYTVKKGEPIEYIFSIRQNSTGKEVSFNVTLVSRKDMTIKALE